MEGHLTLRVVTVEGQGKNSLGRDALDNQAGDVLKTELWVILGMTDQAAAPGAQGLQAGKAFPDQGGPMPMPTGKPQLRYPDQAGLEDRFESG